MPDYSLGKIYMIEPIVEHDEGDIYIGSTCKPRLCMRYAGHKYRYKRWKNEDYGYTTSFSLFETYGVENCKISLIENFDCRSKDELNKREGWFIRNTRCVNRIIPDRTMKEWCKNNAEELKEKKKIYFQENAAKFKEYQKQYQQEHVEELKDKRKTYYQEHAEDISLKQKEKILCKCGKTICKSAISNHNKSQFHTKFLETPSAADNIPFAPANAGANCGIAIDAPVNNGVL
jgi:hypothetical protein